MVFTAVNVAAEGSSTADRRCRKAATDPLRLSVHATGDPAPREGRRSAPRSTSGPPRDHAIRHVLRPVAAVPRGRLSQAGGRRSRDNARAVSRGRPRGLGRAVASSPGPQREAPRGRNASVDRRATRCEPDWPSPPAMPRTAVRSPLRLIRPRRPAAQVVSYPARPRQALFADWR